MQSLRVRRLGTGRRTPRKRHYYAADKERGAKRGEGSKRNGPHPSTSVFSPERVRPAAVLAQELRAFVVAVDVVVVVMVVVVVVVPDHGHACRQQGMLTIWYPGASNHFFFTWALRLRLCGPSVRGREPRGDAPAAPAAAAARLLGVDRVAVGAPLLLLDWFEFERGGGGRWWTEVVEVVRQVDKCGGGRREKGEGGGRKRRKVDDGERRGKTADITVGRYVLVYALGYTFPFLYNFPSSAGLFNHG